jgi:hypothetical protein
VFARQALYSLGHTSAPRIFFKERNKYLVRMWRNLKYTLLLGIYSGIATVGKSLLVLQKVKELTQDPGILLCRHKKKQIFKHLCRKQYYSQQPKLQQSKCPFTDTWINKRGMAMQWSSMQA